MFNSSWRQLLNGCGRCQRVDYTSPLSPSQRLDVPAFSTLAAAAAAALPFALPFCRHRDSVQIAQPLQSRNWGSDMPIVNRIAAMHEEITAWRQDLHANPEIGFEVHRTADIVAQKLKAFGCDAILPHVGKTGVVGVIKGRKTGSGRVVGLRADMDALPIQEATGVAYASKTPGKMH